MSATDCLTCFHPYAEHTSYGCAAVIQRYRMEDSSPDECVCTVRVCDGCLSPKRCSASCPCADCLNEADAGERAKRDAYYDGIRA